MKYRKHPADEPPVLRILEAAQRGIADLRKGDKLRKQIQSMVSSILAKCNELDENNDWMETAQYIESVEAAFAIGAICGKPSDASEFGAGRKGRGGRVQGERSKERAASHKAALLPIFRVLRTQNPTWFDAKLIREARNAYGSRLPVLPEIRQLTNYLVEMVDEGAVPEGPKHGRAKRVTK